MSDSQRNDQPSPVREVEFAIDEPAYPFVAATERLDCSVELAEILPRGPEEYAEFFEIRGCDASRIETLLEAHDSAEGRCLREYDTGALFEFRILGTCPAVTLADLGALPQTVRASDGTGRIVAEVPRGTDTSVVIDDFLGRIWEAEFVAKRETDAIAPPLSGITVRQDLRSRLTERQYEVLESAFEAGYYDWPREASGEAVAAELGISSPTFSQHIQAAERTLLTMLFENQRADD